MAVTVVELYCESTKQEYEKYYTERASENLKIYMYKCPNHKINTNSHVS